MTAHRYHTLIEPAELAALLDDPDVAVIDCRHELAQPEWGAQAYAQGHIPGALFAHLDRDLSGPVTPRSGRHPLPTFESLARTASAWGIDSGVQVIAYDQGPGAYAARLWWLMRWAGHERVAVLNGGLAAWRAAGLPLTSEVRARGVRRFLPRPALERALTTAEVESELARGSIRLVDARGADRFAGQNETIDPMAGHVPGAVNHPFATNLDATGRFLPAAQLAQRWRATASGAAGEALVAMCGSGVTACHNLLALRIAGFEGARLYAGSWSEWIRDAARPIARDPPDA
jgi:thiosulfate/3-mercaptopyruvate sulfurtransferase